MFEDNESDWDADFGDLGHTSPIKPKEIVGIVAPPDASVESWDSDFDEVCRAPSKDSSVSDWDEKIDAKVPGIPMGDLDGSSDSDWDAEPPDPKPEKAQKASKGGVSPPKTNVANATLKIQWSAFEVKELKASQFPLISDQQFTTLKYPPPTLLFSIKTTDGHKNMNHSELESWLNSLIPKYKTTLQSDMDVPKKKHPQDPVGSLGHINHHIDQWKASFLENGTLVWKQIVAFFEEIEKKKFKPQAEDYDGIIEVLWLLGASIPLKSPKDGKKEFSKMMKVLAKKYPSLQQVLLVFESIIFCHHKLKSPVKSLYSLYQTLEKPSSNLSEKDHLTLGVCSNYGTRALIMATLSLYSMGRSPLTCLEDDSEGLSSEDSTASETQFKFLEPKGLMALTSSLYPFLKQSYLKAHLAFVMGLLYLQEEDFQTAEKLMFESCYMLDNPTILHQGLPGLVSSLGAESFRHYGAILHKNSKYKYAALAFDVGLAILELRKHTDEYYTALNTLAKIAATENDLKKAIVCYLGILERFMKGDRRTEVIFVARTISTMCVKLGNFTDAEGFLQQAIKHVYPNQSLSTLTDSTFLGLQLSLAHIYTQSFNFERGLRLLESLQAFVDKFTEGDAKTFRSLLARCYAKKAMFKECNGQLEFVGKQTSYDSAFWKMAAINCHKSNWFTAALFCVDKGIMAAEVDWYSELGQLYYLRGKILKSLIIHSSSISFPTTLAVERNGLEFPEYLLMHSASVTQTCFRGLGDLIQECEATFKQALVYSEAIADSLRIGKASAALAEMWTEYCAPRIAFFDFSFPEACSFPTFSLSLIARNSRETKLQRTTLKSKKQEKKEEEKKDDRKKRARAQDRSQKSSHHKKGDSTSGTIPVSGSKSTDEKSSDLSITVQGSETEQSTNKDYQVKLDQIIAWATEALNVGTDTSNFLLLMRGYLVMAEVQRINEKRDIAVDFWVSFKNSFCSLLIDGNKCLLRDGPPHTLERLTSLVERAVRLLFTFDKDFINSNLEMVDIYLNLRSEVEMAVRRPNYFTFLKQAAVDVSSKKKATLKETLPSMFGKHRPVALHPLEMDLVEDTESDKWKSACAVLWGIFCYIQGQERTDLWDQNQKALKKALQIAGYIRAGNFDKINAVSISSIFQTQQKEKSLTPLPPSIIQTNTKTTTPLPNRKHKPPTPPTKKLPSQLVYILQFHNVILYYCTKSGKVSAQRLSGAQQQQATMTPSLHKHPIFLELFFPGTDELLLLLTRPDLTLAELRAYICDNTNWETPFDASSSSAFGSPGASLLSPSTSTPKPLPPRTLKVAARPASLLPTIPTQINRTACFFKELQKLLSTPEPRKENVKKLSFSTDSDDWNGDFGEREPITQFSGDSSTASNWSGSPDETPRPPAETKRSGDWTISDPPPKPTTNQTSKTKTIGNEPSSSSLTNKNDHPPGNKSSSVSKISLPSKDNLKTTPIIPSRVHTILFSRDKKSPDTQSKHGSGFFEYKMHHKLCELFSNDEILNCHIKAPLRLSIYLSFSSRSQKRAAWDEPVTFSDTIVQNLEALMDPTSHPNAESTFKAIQKDLRVSLKNLARVLPHTEDTELIKNQVQDSEDPWKPFQISRKMTLRKLPKGVNFSNFYGQPPLYLICSHSLQVFPWEAMISDYYENVYRSFTLNELSATGSHQPPPSSDIVFTAFYYSTKCPNEVWDSIKQRKEDLRKRILTPLQLDKPVSPNQSITSSYPSTSPLVTLSTRIGSYRKKYKSVQFVDLSDCRRPVAVAELLDSKYCLLLLSYNDLLEMSDVLVSLRENLPTFIFLREDKIKPFLARLSKLMKNQDGTFSNKFRHFMSCIPLLQNELATNVVIFNSPLLED